MLLSKNSRNRSLTQSWNRKASTATASSRKKMSTMAPQNCMGTREVELAITSLANPRTPLDPEPLPTAQHFTSANGTHYYACPNDTAGN